MAQLFIDFASINPQVAEFKAGEEGEAAPAAATPAQQAAQAAALQEASRPAPKVPPTKPLVEPKPELYTVHVPEGLRLIDLDLIKLTAQVPFTTSDLDWTGNSYAHDDACWVALVTPSYCKTPSLAACSIFRRSLRFSADFPHLLFRVSDPVA